jgi:hypothetical protein
VHDLYVPGVSSRYYFSPLDLRGLYPECSTVTDFTFALATDLRELSEELTEIPTILSVDGAVYVDSLDDRPNGRVRVVGELMLEETNDFHPDAFNAKLDLLIEGFMYCPEDQVWRAAGIL